MLIPTIFVISCQYSAIEVQTTACEDKKSDTTTINSTMPYIRDSCWDWLHADKENKNSMRIA